MYYDAEILDDLLIKAFEAVLEYGSPVTAGRGRNLELTGVLLKLENPRARLSRSETKGRPFSPLAELLWYLSGRNDLEFIERYIPDYADDAEADGTLHGAYGPRLLSMRGVNQVDSVLRALRGGSETRRGVIQLFNAEDIVERRQEVPCTTSIQFMARCGKLNCCVSMRSNDAFKGLPHDIFCFTMIQEMLARDLELDIGSYHHFASSLHIYEDNINAANRYLAEGVHSTLAMPPMPLGPQWEVVPTMIAAEQRIREGAGTSAIDGSLDPYWQDLLRLLLAFELSGDEAAVEGIASGMESDIYRSYLERRKITGKPKPKQKV